MMNKEEIVVKERRNFRKHNQAKDYRSPEDS